MQACGSSMKAAKCSSSMMWSPMWATTMNPRLASLLAPSLASTTSPTTFSWEEGMAPACGQTLRKMDRWDLFFYKTFASAMYDSYEYAFVKFIYRSYMKTVKTVWQFEAFDSLWLPQFALLSLEQVFWTSFLVTFYWEVWMRDKSVKKCFIVSISCQPCKHG